MSTAMTQATAPATAWRWPDEVLEFAEARGVRQYLEPMLEVTRRLFPTGALKVMVERDPEVRDLRWIAFEVWVTVADVPDPVGAHRAWIREELQVCPATLLHNFVSSLRRRAS